MFIYTRSTIRLVSKSQSILPYPRQKQDKIIFLIHNNSPWQVFGRKTARPFTAIRQQVLLFMILGCWQIFSTGTEEFPTWSKCCDFKKNQFHQDGNKSWCSARKPPGLQWSAAGAKRGAQSRRSMVHPKGWTPQNSWAVKLGSGMPLCQRVFVCVSSP